MRCFKLLGVWAAAGLSVCAAAMPAFAGSAVDADPYPVRAGQLVEITYDPAGRVLSGAGQVYAHVGFDHWATVINPDPAMTWDGANSVWRLTVNVPVNASRLDLVFNDGGSTWDNNRDADWQLFVAGDSASTWQMDGQLDGDATLIAENNGNQLYAGLRGSILYVAAPRATAGNDHFIFIANVPGSQQSAPWDKAGTVAAWSAFLGNEVDNGWSGWFDAAGGTESVAGDWLEGTIDLVAEFGGIPSDIYLAFAPYGTNNGASLVTGGQVPASVDGNGNVNAGEYALVDVDSIRVACAQADLNKDCAVDDADYAVFAACLLGPGVVSCSASDFDDDGDVDLRDYATMQALMGGIPFSSTNVAEDLGVNVTRFYPYGVDLGDLPPSMSMDFEPPVLGPAGGSFAVQPVFFKSGDRHVAFIDIDDDVSLYGTGEVFGALRRNGYTTEAWNTDAYAYGPANPSLYQSHPWVLGVRPDGTAFGVLADTTYRCLMDLSVEILFAAQGPEFPIYVFEGDSPQEVLTRLTDFVGRIEMPPMWALGYQQSKFSYVPDWVAQNLANEFRNRDIPCDVIWFDIDYMDGFRVFTFNPFLFPNPLALNNSLHSQGFHTVWMINPGVKAEPGFFVSDSGSAGDHWIYTGPSGSWYTGQVWPGQCFFPDYTRPETRAWWAGLYANYMAQGIDGVWNDMNEPGIFDGPGHSMPESNWHRGGGGLPAGYHQQYHNVFGMLMVKASREGIMDAKPDKRPFVLSRANFIGGHKYAAMWTGDNVANWLHFGQTNAMVLNMGLSAQPFAGPDLGGFAGDGTADLFARWMGVGVFMPFCRAHADNVGVDKEPWSFGPWVEDVSRTAIRRRYRLMPYFYTLFEEATQNGLPVVRPVFFADPADSNLHNEEIAFLIGADLLVVPNVYENPAHQPALSLPLGIWRNVSLVGEDSTNDINQPDLRVRGGAIVPAGPVMEFTQEFPLDPLTLLVSLDESGEAEGWLYEDAGDGYGYTINQYRRTLYTASQSGNTVTVAVAQREGGLPAPQRQVSVQIITDSGVVSATGSDTNLGIVAVVNLP